MFNTEFPAVVFGLSKTAIGVGKSLGRLGISVYGISYQKEIGYYSKYIKGNIFPHPLTNEDDFVLSIQKLCFQLKKKPVLFITSDEYLTFYTRNSSFIKKHFYSNLPKANLIITISDKYKQYSLIKKTGVDLPSTFFVENKTEYNKIKNNIVFPVFIKGRDVNEWREVVGGKIKGFAVYNNQEMLEKIDLLFKKKVAFIIQELVISRDNQNYKICVFISPSGELKLSFTLRKIHQYPIHSGIGSSVESIKYPNLEEIGKKLFSSIGYTGVGSAEFKYDEKDGKLKLIEINPRYWQQNALSDFCEVNFPLMDYQEATKQFPLAITDFREKLKWVNISLEIKSYLKYKKGHCPFSPG